MTPNESQKQEEERDAFSRFVARLGTQENWQSVTSKQPPHPDLLCIHKTEGPIAFEVVSLTNPDVAHVEAGGPKAPKGAFYTDDSPVTIIRKKLHRKYVTDAKRIELLVCLDGRTVLPEDVLIPKIQPWFDAVVPHPFEKVWFTSKDETRLIWP